MMFMRSGIWGIVLQIALKRCEAAIHFLIYFVYTGVILRTLYTSIMKNIKCLGTQFIFQVPNYVSLGSFLSLFFLLVWP